MKRNDVLTVDIVDNGISLEGIAKVEGYTIFVPYAIKGETVEIVIIKANKKFAIGKVLKLVIPCKNRIMPECKIFGRCGSCNAMHIKYDAELDIKKKNVIATFKKQKIDINPDDVKVYGMGNVYNYRNKVSYPVREINGVNKIGFFRNNSHDIIESNSCYIQDEIIDKLAREIFNLLIKLNFTMYNEATLKGDVRHIILRRGYNTGEILVTIVINNEKLLYDERFKNIAGLSGNIKSLNINLNNSNTNEILGEKTVNIFGNEYITDSIGDKLYYISATSFFQVNTVGAEILYYNLKDMLKLNGNEVLFDLYSGVGSIGIFLSDYVSKVYGIEIVKEAVDMANLNIIRNNVTNCEYIAGSVEDKIVEFEKRNITPDVIVVDPPRKGLDEKTIEYILKFNPKKIGYVSCNYASLARDIKSLEGKYNVVDICLVDLFPTTYHIEIVCVLERR